jgi:cellulose synthase/poly-beta-1,6-N-acetylglucosamine synthase-like glycosyltransferase
MDALAPPLLSYYVAAIAVFCVYGLHRYWLVSRLPRANRTIDPPSRFERLPRVTVQLPMFNEARVAERIITAAAALDYPRDRLQIQVLDDSTDECAETARRVSERLAAGGLDIQYLHRSHREGYKAGALAAGLRSAAGEFIAVFDADFVPPPDVLKRMIHHFTDRSVGMVQARWAHLNREESLLTRVQALCLDGHFVIEQAVRAATGRWFNFNGTAGIWRRRCIDDAGGWQHDTLTEDTDLSYRAQLAGWTFRYLPNVACPAELPHDIGALMGQQHRWTKGLTQTAIKLLPAIMHADVPLKTKVEAWFHLTSPLPYVALLVLTLIVGPAFFVSMPGTGMSGPVALVLGLGCLTLGTLATCAFYIAAQRAQGRSIIAAILLLPVLMAIGVGMSLINTRAIVEALLGRHSAFVRTPKTGGAHRAATEPVGMPPRRRFRPVGAPESLLGALMIGCHAFALREPFTLVSVPFLVLFAAGYLGIGLPRLWRALVPGRPWPGRASLRPATAAR